jgi:uncharacterized membrane protein YhaH (DUF805 family)
MNRSSYWGWLVVVALASVLGAVEFGVAAWLAGKVDAVVLVLHAQRA